MAPEPQRDDQAHDRDGEPFVREQLAAIDDDLMRGMPVDARFESGVPEGQRAGALDFIQMTGLTRAPLRQAPPAQAIGRPTALDANEPLSFYEAGVADVDDRMAGGALDAGLRDASLDADLVPDRGGDALGGGDSPSVKAFRDIIAELESGGVTDTPAPPEEDEPQAPEESQPEDALRALVDDLQGTAPVSPEAEPAASVSSPPPPPPPEPEPTASPEGPEESQEVPQEAPPAPAPTEDADDADDADDFDALVASLESSGASASPDSNAEDLSEDWDALLDSVSQADEPAAKPAAETPAARPEALAEAGQLMSALERPPSAPAPAAQPAASLPAGQDTAPGYDYDATPTRRRSRRHSRVARRGWRLVKTAVLLAFLAGSGVCLWYFMLQPWIEQPEDLEAHASQLLADERYADASAAFLKLSRRPNSNRADAQFQAAQVLTQGLAGRPKDEVTERFKKAKELFNDFVEENPEHPKAPRALCIIGRLEYELGNYPEAIAILRDQIAPEDDPAAALAMLRYLARAYVKTGAYDEAETAYLQAATLPGNYSAETDYRELGDMFRTRAGFTDIPAAEMESYKLTAATYWNKALQVPGIDPGANKQLQERLDWLEFTEKTGSGTAENEPALPEPVNNEPLPAGPVVSSPAAPDSDASPVPSPGAGSDRVEDPGAMMDSTLPGTPPGDSSAGTAVDTPPA